MKIAFPMILSSRNLSSDELLAFPFVSNILVLCRKHQKTFEEDKRDENSDGLSARESRYKEDMIKWRIAETLVEELFLSLEYNVFRYGMENTVPGIMELLKGVRGDVATNIRRMPDFVIQSKDKKVFFCRSKIQGKRRI